MEILAKMFRWCHRSKTIIHQKAGLRTEVQYSIFCVRGGRVQLQSVLWHFSISNSISKAQQSVFQANNISSCVGLEHISGNLGSANGQEAGGRGEGDLTLQLLVLTSNPIACQRACRGRFHQNFPPDYLSDCPFLPPLAFIFITLHHTSPRVKHVYMHMHHQSPIIHDNGFHP